MSAPAPTPAEARALMARARVYGLLAHLILRGLDEPRRTTLQTLDWLVPSPELDLDTLAADHHRYFELELFPYAGVYLDASARAGAWAERVRARYLRVGFRPRLDELAGDHLGIELACASFICAAASEAIEDGHRALAARLLTELAGFYDDAVLSWLPALVATGEALATSGEPRYWSRVLSASLELVAEHRQTLAARGLAPGPVPAPTLAPGPDILADPRTGLRQIAARLLVPAASGLGLTRADLAGLGRGRALPRGFGSRLIMLDNLLHSAVDYGELDGLLADLRALVDARDARYAALASDPELALGAALDPWRAALGRTQTLLDTLAAATPESTSWTSKPSTTTPPAP